MNTDIRVAVSFVNHRKRKKLSAMLDVPDAGGFVLNLWLNTAMNHPKGVLTGMDEYDVAIEAGWIGDAETFVEALLRCGFLKKTESGEYAVHEWEEHQGYAVYAGERKEKARRAANLRWEKRSGEKNKTREADNSESNSGDAMLNDESSNAKICNEQCYTHDLALPNCEISNAPSPSPSPSPVPSPVPSPSPTPNGVVKNTFSSAGSDESSPSDGSSPASPDMPLVLKADKRQETKAPPQPPCPHKAIIELYHEILPIAPRVQIWGGASKTHLQQLWRTETERQSLNWWREFFARVSRSDWLTGKVQGSKTGKPFIASLDWLVKPENFRKVLNGNYDNHRNGVERAARDPTPRAAQRHRQEELPPMTYENYGTVWEWAPWPDDGEAKGGDVALGKTGIAIRHKTGGDEIQTPA